MVAATTVAAGDPSNVITKENPDIVGVFEEEGAPEVEVGEVPASSRPEVKGHKMLAPFTSSEAHPLVIDRSEGVYVFDSEGKKYLDSLAGLWCLSLGGSERRLVEAATKQLEKLPFYHSFWNRTTAPALDLAKELLELFSPIVPMGKVFFTNSGSEANDTHVKLVWYYNNALGRPQKKKFISRMKGYHGSTLISASLTGLNPLHQSFDLPLNFVLHTDCPHYWRYHLPGESEEDFSARLAQNLEDLILREGPETIAAFIAEPVMGAGGVMPPPAGYWAKVQPILKKYDILLIADEVVCAFGRLGTMFGCEKYGIKPDLVTLAKALSSAYQPIGAILISQHISDEIAAHSAKLGVFAHGFTYSGHPVACAVALETLAIYKERNIVKHVQEMEPLFQGPMRKLEQSPIIGEVRGVGLIMAVEFVADKEKKTGFPPEWGVVPFFASRTAEHGMLVRVGGDAVMMSPPLVITAEEVEELVGIFSKAVAETEEYVAAKRSLAAA